MVEVKENQPNEEKPTPKSYYTLLEVSTKFVGEAAKILNTKCIPFKLIKGAVYHNEEEEHEELPLISIDKELYAKMKKLSELINLDLGTFASKELRSTIEDFLEFQPLDFLDSHTDLNNIPNIYELMKKLNEIHPLDDLECYQALTTKENLRRDKDGLLQIKEGIVWKWI